MKMKAKSIKVERTALQIRLVLYCFCLSAFVGICYHIGSGNSNSTAEKGSLSTVENAGWKKTLLQSRQEYLDVLDTPLVDSFKWRDGKESFFSAHSCFGSHMQDFSWMTTSCQFQNACFNISSKEILYFKAPSDEVPPTVSITVVNYRWGMMYDESIKFEPRVVEGPLNQGHWVASPDDIFVFHLCHVPQNPGHLIWDDYWTWFMTSAATTSLQESTTSRIRPIWYNVPNNPPWATCDWVFQHSGPGHRLSRKHAENCYKINGKWLRTFLGPGHASPPQTGQWLTDRPDIRSKSDLVCFGKSIIGSGATSRNMGGHDGWVSDDVLPPTAGRGPLVESFRSHIVKRVLNSERSTLPRLLIYVSQYSSNRMAWNMVSQARTLNENLAQLTKLAREISGVASLKVEVEAGVLWHLSASEQVRKMTETSIYLGVAGGGAMSAQFLPRGAGLVLYHNPQDHEGKDDWKIFGMFSPIRVDFLPGKERENSTLLLTTIANQIAACASFMRYSPIE